MEGCGKATFLDLLEEEEEDDDDDESFSDAADDFPDLDLEKDLESDC